MRCPTCSTDVPEGQDFCPHCGTFSGQDPTAARAFWAMVIVVVITLSAMGTAVGYLIAKRGMPARAISEDSSACEDAAGVPVLHGGVVGSEQLHRRGKLYFVPIGTQAISAKDLADYYRQKFGLEITVLPTLPLEESSCIVWREQCIAEEMIISMKRAYPKIAREPDAVMIALTDEDIFPRSLGWRFTYAFHAGYPSAIVSTHRMDPAFWGDPPNDAVRLANTKQMLTKYIAFMYFRVPYSLDPTSIMHQPLTPNGGPDDIYESDLHSEESANGFSGEETPCLFFAYSYDTGQIEVASPLIADCDWMMPVRSTQEETFQTQLNIGQVTQRSMDLQLASMPDIEFRRSYLSQYPQTMALGIGANHNYNSWLYSDGESKLSFVDIIHEDGARDHLHRASPGRGFSPGVVFQSDNDSELIYGARMTWDSDHFKLQFRDSAWSAYLACHDGPYCYWNGYQDAAGNTLRFQRDAALNLQQLTADDNQRIDFQYDAQRRIIAASGTNGARVSYQYAPNGCLERVVRADGIVTIYGYDSRHRMISVSVVRQPGDSPNTVLQMEYDSTGRVVHEKLSNGDSYTIQYVTTQGNHVVAVKVTDASGRVLDVSLSKNDFTVRTSPVRFPAIEK